MAYTPNVYTGKLSAEDTNALEHVLKLPGDRHFAEVKVLAARKRGTEEKYAFVLAALADSRVRSACQREAERTRFRK